MTEGSDEQAVARVMIEVHGMRAASVARENGRSAGLAGQGMRIRVLDIIQGAGPASPTRPPRDPSADSAKIK
jgi:hypothetical protein